MVLVRMAADTRPSHAGPSVLADIENLAGPAQAPETIRFSPTLVALFQMERYRSYPAGRSKEQGGTIVADKSGHFSVQNLGGLGSTAGTFTPNLVANDPAHFRVVGTFHTHPYDRTEGSMNGVAFSGGDVAALILSNILISVVQSGPRTFVYLRTSLTPRQVDYAGAFAAANAELKRRVQAGQAFQQASRIIAQERASQFKLAYYQGLNGVTTRV